MRLHASEEIPTNIPVNPPTNFPDSIGRKNQNMSQKRKIVGESGVKWGILRIFGDKFSIKMYACVF